MYNHIFNTVDSLFNAVLNLQFHHFASNRERHTLLQFQILNNCPKNKYKQNCFLEFLIQENNFVWIFIMKL